MIGRARLGDDGGASDAERPRGVSIIVVNYNGRRWLEGCLLAVVADLPDDCEVIVVDNGSTDGSAEFIRARFPAVHLVELGRNTGFATANNRGAEVATGRFLAFLNNDTEVQPGWCSRLRATLEGDPSAGLAAARVVFLDDPLTVDSAGDGITTVGGAFKRGHGEPASRWAAGGEVFGACGAACMVRRELFEQVGGFDEDFFMVFEDVDLSWRVRLRGARCVYVPEAIVRHAVSASLGRASEIAVFFGQRNLEWCYLKNMPAPLLAATLIGHVGYVVAAAVYFARIGRLRAFLRGKVAAMGHLRRVLRKRRAVQEARVLSSRQVWDLMTPRWLTVKIQEKRARGGA